MVSELLRQVRVIDPVAQSDRIADVLIQDGWVLAMESYIEAPAETQIHDGTGRVLGPGLVDLYSHSGEPGFESRETLSSLAKAATAGGFTRLTLLPDTSPPVDRPGSLSWFQSRLSPASGPQIFHWGALTLGVKGQQMVELAELAEAGVAGFADGQPIANWALLRRLLEYGKPFHKPIALWCCDRDIEGNGIVREGAESMRLGLSGSPAMAETAPLAALLELVAELGTPIHLMRVSTARSVALIRSARAQGLPITASATWLHLVLSVLDLKSYDPNLRLDPPLGNPTDREALAQAVQDGVIDAIAVDHSPYTYEEKTVAFAEAPAGAIGLELALPVLWQTFVATGQWEALTLWRSLSANPARCLNQAPPTIAPHQPAELVLFDPQQRWQVTPQMLRSIACNTSWLGQELTGRVIKTWGPVI